MKQIFALVLVVLLSIFACSHTKNAIGNKRIANNEPANQPNADATILPAAELSGLKINQVQIIASHNSYHLRTDAAVLRFLSGLYKMHILPRDLNPEWIDYTNASLTEQLQKYGVRGLELDVWNDPEGGRYYNRMGKSFVFKSVSSKVEALKKPGFKILHIPDFDFMSTNYTLVDALQEIKKWSDANPKHLPVFINIETEVSTPGDEMHMLKRMTHAAPFDSLAAENIDKEIKSVFGENLEGVLTPDEVRAGYPSLEQAVLAGNWPTVKAAAGKVVFIVDGDGNSNEVYKKGHPSLHGRAMFVYAAPGTAEAAFVIQNDALRDFKNIKKLVAQGYIVRTRSDDGTKQARSGDSTDMRAAISSWAQIISTDYYRPDYRAGTKGWTSYHVQVPGGGMARVDSIAATRFIKNTVIKE